MFGAGRRLGKTEAIVDVDLSAQGRADHPAGTERSRQEHPCCGVWPRSGCRTLDPSSSTVSIPGTKATGPKSVAASATYPRDCGLAPSATVFDVVDYLAVMKSIGRGSRHPERWRRLEVMELLDLVGLADQAAEKVASLSRGMKQRVALAQALLGGPTLLLLDEPASGLDPEERSRLRSILGERRRRTTIIQSTHLTDQAAYSDRILVMAGGRIRFDGSPTRLAGLADGKTWTQAHQPAAGSTLTFWQTSDGHYRCLGTPPQGIDIVPPTVEDATCSCSTDERQVSVSP